METKGQKSVISVLFELCSRKRLTVLFEEVGRERRPNNELLFAMRVSAGDFNGSGIGKNMKVAKARASFQLLQKVIHCDAYKSWGIPGDTKEEALQYLGTLHCGTEKDAIDQTSAEKEVPTPNRTPVATLNELCMKRGYPLPRYEDVFENVLHPMGDGQTAAHERVFFVRVVLDILVRIGKGATKREARQSAAALALEALSSIQDLDFNSEFPMEDELDLGNYEADGEESDPMDSEAFDFTLESLSTVDLDNMPTGTSYTDLMWKLFPKETVPFSFHYVEREGVCLVELTVFGRGDREEKVHARAETLRGAMDAAALKYLRSLQTRMIENPP